jgi:hypothetical protein
MNMSDRDPWIGSSKRADLNVGHREYVLLRLPFNTDDGVPVGLEVFVDGERGIVRIGATEFDPTTGEPDRGWDVWEGRLEDALDVKRLRETLRKMREAPRERNAHVYRLRAEIVRLRDALWQIAEGDEPPTYARKVLEDSQWPQ